MVISAALDLGTTMIKGGVLNEDGMLVKRLSVEAPPVIANGLRWESDAKAYYESATVLRNQLLKDLPSDTPVGLASQRSSFLLWDRYTGEPLTPLISWQDRRAEEWCNEHQDVDLEHLSNTGLIMAPHYPAAKLAYLFSENESFSARSDSLMFGQIDTYCMWGWCREHIVDYSMAARTLLYEAGGDTWSEYMLKFFNIPKMIMPQIVETYGRSSRMSDGREINASISDQASGLMSLECRDGTVLVNLGTGGFVNVCTGTEQKRVKGFLTGPVMRAPDGSTVYATEGTINGLAAAFTGCDVDSIKFPVEDLWWACFCIPDAAGVGAPFWKAEKGPIWSESAEGLSATDRARIMLEGLVFRICHIIDSIVPPDNEAVIYLSGGMSRCPFLREGLAGCLGRPLRLLIERESTLVGAARLAAGKIECSDPKYEDIRESGEANYLQKKYLKWQEWIAEV